MNVFRRAAQLAVDINKVHSEAIIRLYRRLGLYEKIYTACGMPRAIAARLEEGMLDAMCVGVEEQHALASRWVSGETDFAEFVAQYGQWFGQYVARCSDVTVAAFSPAAVSQ